MNTEQPDREPADETLSAVYRSVSNERVPERLDEQVLREASRALRSPYAPPIRWSRPLAWAAVIAITFAILLQVAELPTPESDEIGLPKAAEREDDAAAIADAEPEVRTRQRSESTAAAPAGAPQQEAVPAAAPESGEMPPPGRAETPDAAVPREAAGISAQGTNLLDRAAQTASEQLPEAPRAPSPQAAGLAREFETREPAAECSADEQTEPESWYACIERLRDAGRETEADAQLRALREAFPDFEPPR